MAGKINLFNLGSLGVDLVKSPLHIPDGAWTQLQNGEFNPVGAQGAIKKRGALLPINSVALAGAIRALLNVPLPIAQTKVLMVALTAVETPDSWKTTTDGAAFTDLADVDVPIVLQDKNLVGFSIVGAIGCRPASIGRVFIYAGNDYTVDTDDPPVMLYNGAAAYELFRLPRNPTTSGGGPARLLLSMHVANGLVYFGCVDPTDGACSAPNLRGRVLQFDPTNGILQEIGNRFGCGANENQGGAPFSLTTYAGRLWAGTYGSSGNEVGKIYSIIPGIDTEWVVDHSSTLHNGYYLDLCPFRGKLYAATSADSAGTAVVEQRTAAGVWTTSLSAPSNNISTFYGLIVYNDELYVCWQGGALGTQFTIYKFDGSSWTTDLDITATFGGTIGRPTQPFVYDGDLFWPVPDASAGGQDGYLLKRSGGTWTKAIDNIGIRGALGRFTPDA